jgi:hypothetical protein
MIPASAPLARPVAAERQHGWAWIGLALALALHVADEAAHDFLSVYNPNARMIRERISWLPVPVFGFTEWIAGLAAAVLLLLALSPLVFRGVRAMRLLSYLLGGLMALNGLQHTIASIYMGRAMPGVLSSPVLFAASIWLIVTARRTLR